MAHPVILTSKQRKLLNKIERPEDRRMACLYFAGDYVNQLDLCKKVFPGKEMSADAATSRVSRFLKREEVQTFLAAMEESLVKDSIMTKEEALERLSAIARASIGDMMEFSTHFMGHDEEGNLVEVTRVQLKNSEDLSADQLTAIAELQSTPGGLKVKLHSSMTAIQQMAAMQNWNEKGPQKIDLISSDGSMTPSAAFDVSKLSTGALTEILQQFEAQQKEADGESTEAE